MDLHLETQVYNYTTITTNAINSDLLSRPQTQNGILSCAMYVDSSFSWANAGAAVFGSAVSSASKTTGGDGGSEEEEAPNNEDIHFEPIVSLPEVAYRTKLPSSYHEFSDCLLHSWHISVSGGNQVWRGG